MQFSVFVAAVCGTFVFLLFGCFNFSHFLFVSSHIVCLYFAAVYTIQACVSVCISEASHAVMYGVVFFALRFRGFVFVPISKCLTV